VPRCLSNEHSDDSATNLSECSRSAFSGLLLAIPSFKVITRSMLRAIPGLFAAPVKTTFLHRGWILDQVVAIGTRNRQLANSGDSWRAYCSARRQRGKTADGDCLRRGTNRRILSQQRTNPSRKTSHVSALTEKCTADFICSFSRSSRSIESLIDLLPRIGVRRCGPILTACICGRWASSY
jgi:hypothetical protein